MPPFHAHGPPPYAVASPHHPQYVRIPAGAGVVAQQVMSLCSFSWFLFNSTNLGTQVVDEEKDRWRVEAAKWTEHKAEEGIYYYNAESGESTWECPPAVAFKKKIEDSGFAMYVRYALRSIALPVCCCCYCCVIRLSLNSGKRLKGPSGCAFMQRMETSIITNPRHASLVPTISSSSRPHCH